jgi:hypothetical protein
MYIDSIIIKMEHEQQHNECSPNEENELQQIEQSEEQMIMDDEAYARQLQEEFIQEAMLEEQHQQERMRETRRLENEENARIRLQQDMEYLECLNVIPKNNITTVQNIENIPPPPPTSPEPIQEVELGEEKEQEPVISKPPEHFICPISKRIIDIPIRDNEDNICYDKKSLLLYLKENNNKNHNGKTVDKQNLITDNNLKTDIFLWLRDHPEYRDYKDFE